MAIERTLSIVKPDAVAKNHIGDIFARFEKAGLKIVATKMKHLSQAEAEGFYAEHKERGFFADLVAGYRDWETDRKSTRLNSSHITRARMPSSA